MTLPPRDHRISLDAAAARTRAYQAAKISGVKGAAAHKDQVLELLNQKGCVGLRVYFGLDADGVPTPVLTGIDAADNDLTDGVILEQLWPCPPFCGGDNALNS